MTFRTLLLHGCTAAILSLSLSGCGDMGGLFGPEKPVKTAKIRSGKTSKPLPLNAITVPISGGFYLEKVQLTLLEVADSQEISNLKAIKSYTEQSSANPEKLPAIILTFKNGAASERLILSATPPATLPAMMKKLESTGYRLQDIHLVNVTLAPAPIPGELEGTALRQVLQQQEQQIADSAQKLPPLEEAKLQLELIRFFIKQRCRDAAYLSVDNVKRLLADATSAQPGDKALIESLSQQVETLDTELRKTMPYTLS